MNNKKIYKTILSNLLFLLIGLSFAFGVIYVRAALSHVNSGDPLSATTWNAMVDDLNSAKTDISTINSSIGGLKELYFGGMWGYPSNAYINGVTGARTCPPGYIAREIYGTTGRDYGMVVCVGVPGVVNPVALFGGMWSSWYDNPVTGNKSCPSGFNQQQILGTDGVDFGLYYCYKTTLTNPVINHFGGMYGQSGTQIGFFPNPATHGPDCGLDYNKVTVFGTQDMDWGFHICIN